MMCAVAHDESPSGEAPRITVVLADDHAVVRSGLRMLLEAEPGREVVAEAATAEDALPTRVRIDRVCS